MPQIKDDLGREFISLLALSSILNLSTKQVRRHVRNKRLLSIKRGQRRYVLKDDILREYPSLSFESLNRDIRDISMDKRDTIGTSIAENDVPDVLNVHDVPFSKEIDLYQKDPKTDILLTKIEQVKTVMTRLEKSIADIGYIQQDTKTIDRKLDRLNTKMSQIEGQKGHKGHKIFFGVLVIVVLAITGAGIYGVIQFKELYTATQKSYYSQLTAKDKEIAVASEKYANTIKHYEQETSEKALTIEKMKVKSEQQLQQIQFLQETEELKKREPDGYKDIESHL